MAFLTVEVARGRSGKLSPLPRILKRTFLKRSSRLGTVSPALSGSAYGGRIGGQASISSDWVITTNLTVVLLTYVAGCTRR